MMICPHSTTRSVSPVWMLSIIFLAALAVSGCGRKGMPSRPDEEASFKVQNLQAVVKGKGVEISWNLPQLKADAEVKSTDARYSVMRAEIKWENRGCLDCPTPNQDEVALIDPGSPFPAVMENRKLILTDTAVSMQRVYRYQVTATDKRGRTLATSGTVTVKILPAPSPVKGLTAVMDQQGILLQWKASNKDEQGHKLAGDVQFLVERSSAKNGWEKVTPSFIKATSYLDQAVAADQSYDYRVTPLFLFEDTTILGESAIFRQAKAPGAIAPPPPGSVWAIPVKGGLEVRWTESDAKIAGYYVYRREGKEIVRLTAEPIQHPPFIDRNVKPNATYHYAVSAVGNQPNQREGLLSKWAESRSVSFE